MNKRGFTLVELMVVIIIMGLLAAVGVPKLVGVIAKSKATEVQPAAAAYVKLQKAYMAEKGGVGTWKKIGYTAPGKMVVSDDETTYQTDNFAYGGSGIEINTTVKKTDLRTVLRTAKVGWIARNRNNLNGCASGNQWVVKVSAINDTTVLYEAKMSDISSGCAALTSGWGISDNGITYKDTEFETANAVTRPSEIPVNTSSDDPEEDEGFKVDVEASLSCDKQGWLNGVKNGWINSHPECFKLRQLYFTNGILNCIGNDHGLVENKKDGETYEKCTKFGYTETGRCKIFGEGCKTESSDSQVGEGEGSDEGGSTGETGSGESSGGSSGTGSESKVELYVSCPTTPLQLRKNETSATINPNVVGCSSDCTCEVKSGSKSCAKHEKSTCSSVTFTDNTKKSNNQTIEYTLLVSKAGETERCDFKVLYSNN